MFGIIYKVTNVVNGKVYIGQTVRKLSDRINCHYKQATSDNPHCKHFHSALQKYNKLCFTWEVIDTSDTEDELYDKEVYWISYFNSFRDRTKGYNLNEGGKGNTRIDMKYVSNLFLEGYNVTEISKLTKYDRGQLLQRLPLYIGKEKYLKIIEIREAKRKQKAILQFTKDDFLPLIDNDFSFHEMATYLGVSRFGIQTNIKKLFGMVVYNSISKKNIKNRKLKMQEAGDRAVNLKIKDLYLLIEKWKKGITLRKLSDELHMCNKTLKKHIIKLIGVREYNKIVFEKTGIKRGSI